MRISTTSGLRGLLLVSVCPLAIAAGIVPAQAQTAPSAGSAPTHHAHKHAKKSVHSTAASTAPTDNGVAVPAAAVTAPTLVAPAGHSSRSAVSSMDSGESVIVTGTRNLGKKARDSTSPIDVISAATLSRSGQVNLSAQLSRTDPSISIQAYGADTQALVAAIRLRGLNPNDVLVLIDGKRRHMTSNITADAGPEQGATPVDLNMIPAAAIDHIEILRDGAAAQYGSDAIAGVVNVIMKKTNHGGSATAFTGASAYNGDGWQYQLDADKGFSFGDDGYVHVGGQVYHTDHFVTQAIDDRSTASPFWPQRTSTPFSTPGDSNKILGLPEETRETLSIDFGKTLVQNAFGGIEGYGLITYGHRHAEAYENYRTPYIAPTLYPWGFSPLETDEENDYAATLGVKANDVFGFHADLSTTYGEDLTNIGNKNTANPYLLTTAETGLPSYGYPLNFSPTTVLAQSQANAQWTNNLDFTKPFTAFGKKMNIAFGAEERSEVYVLGAGSPASTVGGGTQGFAGLLPANAGRFSRNVWAGYIDYDVHPLQHWDVDFAGRFEHYTDAGNTENGKISTRYDFTKWLALRGTISNGFRAPTLAEENYSSLNVSPTGASGILATTSKGAQSIGAVPLKAERSTNASAGIVLQPLSNLSITADVYQINIRDRIVGAGGLSGDQTSGSGATATSAIEATGATLPTSIDPSNVSAYYFANGASTRTQGADVNVDYHSNFHQYGTVNWTAAIDLNRTRLHHNGTDAFGNPFINEQSISYLTTATPRSKIILNAYWKKDRWDANLRWTRYGQTKDMVTYQDLSPKDIRYSSTQFAQFVNTPQWLTDLEVGYQLTSRLHLAIGANNLFNLRPRKMPPELSYLNVAFYDQTSSTIPINGGFYYGRLNFKF